MMRRGLIALVAAAGVSATAGAQQTIAVREPQAPDARVAAALFARPVTVRIDRASLRDAIDAVAAAAGVRALYQSEITSARTRQVTLRVSGVTLGEALDQVLAGTGLAATAIGEASFGVVPETSAAVRRATQASGTVAGRVTDSASGRALAGATVKVQGTKLGATTNEQGRFVVRNVPLGTQVVAVRLFGYRPAAREVTVADGEPVTLAVSLSTTPTVLSGVVTTAAGTQRRLEVGTDVTILNVDSLRQVAPISTVTDLLESRVPGLMVMHTSGIPGAPSRVRLRGATSITRSNDPIVIVDGIRVSGAQQGPATPGRTGGYTLAKADYATASPLDQIDPNSIETIEVLKGPSASAMYGSDAGNGVIVITTKKGRPGKTRWDLALDQGVSFQPGDYPVGTYRFGHFFDAPTGTCYLMDTRCTFDSVATFQALNDPRYTVLGAHGLDRGASLTVSGGAGQLGYSVTGTLRGQTGQLTLPAIEVERFRRFHDFEPPSWMKRPDRYNTQGASSALTLPVGSTSTAGGRQGTVQLQSSLFKSDQQQSSLQTAIGHLQAMYVDTTQLDQFPLVPEFYERVTTAQTRYTNKASLNWPVMPWLPVTVTGGVDVLSGTTEALMPRDYAPAADSSGHYGLTNQSNTQGTLNVMTEIPSHVVRTSLGFNWANQHDRTFVAVVQGLPIGVTEPTDFGGVIPGLSSPNTMQSSTETSTYGWFVQPQFNLSSRFWASPGFRLDGGSASGGRVSSHGIPGVSGFPKMDFSYLVVDPSRNEGASGLRGVVTMLRLRGAFGTAGEQPNPGSQLRLLAPTAVVIDGVTRDIAALSGLGNTRLRPERSRETDYGFDLGLWRNRVELTLTGVRKMRYDAIIPIPVAPSVLPSPSSFQLPVVIDKNIGVVRATNFEATANAQLLERAALGWHVGANMTRHSDLVVRLAPGQDVIQTGYTADGVYTRVAPGYPLNGLWTRPILGYGDTDQNGIITPDEVLIGDSAVYVGRPSPNYELALSTDLTLLRGRLSLHATASYQNGMTQTNNALSQQTSIITGFVNRTITSAGALFANDPSLPLAQQAAYAAYLGNAVTGYLFPSGTPYGLLQTVNLWRWQSLSINYQAPERLARLARAQRLMIALQGSNLGTHTNYRGKDPSVNAFTSGESVTDNGQLPLPRLFRLTFTFSN